jgi:ferredoxin
MRINTLRFIRVILAVLVFSPILLFFCDFANILPKQVHGLLHLQVVPAIMSGSIGILILLFLLAILYGRIYCSVICPLGVFQDIVAWFTQRGKKKNKKKRWYKYARPLTILRYSILCLCIVFLILGINTPLLLLDPYSNFGRIAVNIFRPLVMEGNNLLNWVALKLHVYNFYYVTIYTVTGWSFAIAATILLIVVIMALLRGRLFCNTICPVGSLLGLFSRFSLFKITLNDSLCNSCGLCEKACKSQCINSKEKTVDHSRCVACFNCLKRCKSDGVSYRFTYKRLPQPVINAKDSPEIVNRTNVIGMTRRSFFATATTIAATLPVLPAWAKRGKRNNSIEQTPDTHLFSWRHRFRNRDRGNDLPITPPGSKSLTHFEEHCTACHLCVTHCPQQILKPAGFNYGINYVFKPHLVFYENAFCNYECTVCSEVCPNGAIRRLTKDEKKVTQVGIAQFRRGRCIVITENTSCGACSEHCPTQAVRMEPYIDNLTLPQVYAELCIGCGGCESICPVEPIKAINVIANEVHQTAEKPPEEEMLEIDQNELNFGF